MRRGSDLRDSWRTEQSPVRGSFRDAKAFHLPPQTSTTNGANGFAATYGSVHATGAACKSENVSAATLMVVARCWKNAVGEEMLHVLLLSLGETKTEAPFATTDLKLEGDFGHQT